MYKKLVWILAIILLLLMADRFILTPNDIKIDIKPEVLRASTSSELSINVYRTNLLGFKAPFSKVEAQFLIEEGKNLIELSGEGTGSSIIVRSKGIEGEASVGIYSLKSGMQIRKVLIKVLPRDVALN
jgi:hypothetical protein